MSAVVRVLAGALLASALAGPTAAADPQAEIDALIAALAGSGCEFQRNGSWHGAARAKAHLQRKYDWLRRRGLADTSELFFNDVRVPVANRLGDEGKGFAYLAANLAQERLSIAIAGVSAARAALGWTLDYVGERTAFGKSIGTFQNTKFVLAEVATDVRLA